MKKNIRYCIAFSFLLIAGSACSQNISIGAEGGISIPNLSAPHSHQTPVNTGYESRLGPDAALFIQFHLSPFFSIQPMLEYSSEGGKKNGLQAFSTPSAAAAYFQYLNKPVPAYLYGNFNSDVRLNYAMLPVLVKGERALGSSPFHLFANVGPFASVLLSAHDVTHGNSPIYTDAKGTQPLPGLNSFSFNYDTSIIKSLNRFNAGIEGHLGLSYTTGSSTFFVEGGGNYGFLNIQKNKADGKNNIGAVVAVAGFSFTL